MQPYPDPVAVKTKTRCKFGLPGRRYDCRRIGKYILDGKGYCGPHYDAKWKAGNPIFGQQCAWEDRRLADGKTIPCCKICGHVKQHEGLAQPPCAGHMPTITLRCA